MQQTLLSIDNLMLTLDFSAEKANKLQASL
jgi:hypothetical protein